MHIIREYEVLSQICTIRAETYEHSLAHIQKLFAEAQKDFPDLKPEHVRVVKYGGDRISRSFGIEFHRPIVFVPKNYPIIRELEVTL